MKKSAGLAAAFLLLFGLVYGVTRGPWLGGVLSWFLHRKTGIEAGFLNARVEGLSRIGFHSASFRENGGRLRARTGPGALRLVDPFWGSDNRRKVEWSFHQAVLSKDLYKNLPVLSHAFGYLFEGAVKAHQVKVLLVEGPSFFSVRLLQCLSPDFSMRGGIRFEGGRFKKAHFLLFGSVRAIDKVPGQIRSRMIYWNKSWAGFRVIFYPHEVVCIGRKGPLFQVAWEPRRVFKPV
ncbi:MAG: hypothetical protein HY593_06110 [Candidatus Omnitrophica bacterium]|nr:hypothetical protein [Candidatus Omnitrophota bacterium]